MRHKSRRKSNVMTYQRVLKTLNETQHGFAASGFGARTLGVELVIVEVSDAFQSSIEIDNAKLVIFANVGRLYQGHNVHAFQHRRHGRTVLMGRE